jgi:hypothetical protein
MSVTYASGIPELIGKVEAGVQAAVSRRTFDLLARSRNYVPVQTGYLKNSGSVHVGEGQGVVSYSANYAAFVELGTRYMQPGRHYLLKSFHEVVPLFEADLRRLFT